MWMFPNSYDNCLLGGVLAIDKIKFVKNHWEHPDATLGLSVNGFAFSADTDGASSVNRLIKPLRSTWKYVEKVNAHLVVED